MSLSEEYNVRLANAAKNMADIRQKDIENLASLQLERLTTALEHHDSGLYHVRMTNLMPSVAKMMRSHFNVREVKLSDGDYYEITPKIKDE